MDGITRLDIDKAVKVLRKNRLYKEAKAIERAEIIPNLYIAAYVKSLRTQLDTIKDPEDLRDIEHKLEASVIDLAPSKLEAVKQVLYNATKRLNLVCDYKDSRHPKYKTGTCQCETHLENGYSVKKQRLQLVLMVDEDTDKMDENQPEYWCRRCMRDLSEDGDFLPVSCDMEI